MRIRVLAALLAAGAASARGAPAPAATGCQSSGASVEYIVEGAGGGYEVNVSPGFVTVFHLPEPITNAFLSDKKSFSANVFTTTVLVYPQREGLTANLNIDTKSLHISVVMKSGPVAQAKSQVIFTSLEPQRKIEEEVERRIAPLREDLGEKIKARARDEIAAGLLRDFSAREASGIARNDDNVVLRVTRAIKIGEDYFLYFTVENRGSAAWAIAGAKAVQADKQALGKVIFEAKPEGAPTASVPAGGEAAGVLVLAAPPFRAGREVEVRFVDARGAGVVIRGLRID